MPEQQNAAELEEKQNMKRKILGYNGREEEELNGERSPGSGNGWCQGGRTDEPPAGRVIWDGPNRGGGVQCSTAALLGLLVGSSVAMEGR